MEIREVDRGDEGALHRFWGMGKLADDATRPFDFHLPWESARVSYTQGRAGFRNVLLAVHDGRRMVGRALLVYPDLDNTHVAYADIAVDPTWWRRGPGPGVRRLARLPRRGTLRRAPEGAVMPVDAEDPAALAAWPPDHRRRGYGTVMLDHVLDVARGHGRARMVGSVHTPYDGPADGSGHPDREWGQLMGTLMVEAPTGLGFPRVEREVELVRSL